MHEHVARAMYYASIHLLFASMAVVAALLLTRIRGASATAKYWIWVAAAFNFVVPLGALVDELLAARLTWAHPLEAVGGPVWEMTQGRTAIVLALIWLTGAVAMSLRLISRLRRERQAEIPRAGGPRATSAFRVGGVPVIFDARHAAPVVCGLISPRILLPMGIERLLDPRELDAVLIHEVAHARRRDNLIRLLYEVALCVLWFHPLLWLAGARIALYRELSCDEPVIRRAHGHALVSALAKLALPESAPVLQATASSHLVDRLARLGGPPRAEHRAGNLVVASLFAAVVAAGVFQTIAHTACCFLLNR